MSKNIRTYTYDIPNTNSYLLNTSTYNDISPIRPQGRRINMNRPLSKKIPRMAPRYRGHSVKASMSKTRHGGSKNRSKSQKRKSRR